MPETMLIPSKWYQSSSVSGDLAGSPANSEFCDMFSQSKLEAKIDEITDRLCQNIEKIVGDAISRFKSECKLIREELKNEKPEVDDAKQTATTDVPSGDVEITSLEEKLVVEKADLELSSFADNLIGDFLGGSEKSDSEIGCGVESFARKLNYGGRLGDFGDGFTGGGPGEIVSEQGGGYCGRAGGFHSDLEGILAGKVERGGRITASGGLNRAGIFLRGGSGASGSGGGPGCRVAREEGGRGHKTDGDKSRVTFSGGNDFSPLFGVQSGGFLGGFQTSLERDEYRRSFGSFVGLEKKTEIEYACKGNMVILLEAIAREFHLLGHVLLKLREASRLQSNPNHKSGLLSCIGPAYLQSLFSLQGKTQILEYGLIDLRPIFSSSTLIAQYVLYHANSSVHGSALSVTVAEVDIRSRGRESSSDYKPP